MPCLRKPLLDSGKLDLGLVLGGTWLWIKGRVLQIRRLQFVCVSMFVACLFHVKVCHLSVRETHGVRLLNLKCPKICIILNLDSVKCYYGPLTYCPASDKGFKSAFKWFLIVSNWQTVERVGFFFANIALATYNVGIHSRIFWKRYRRQMDLLCPISFFRPKTISKVAIIKTESATIALFSSSPFFFSFPFPSLVWFWSLSGPRNLPFDSFSLKWRQIPLGWFS